MAYSGQPLTIPCSAGGLNANRNKTEIPATGMVPSGTRNLNLHEGGRRKRGGTSHVNGSVIESGARIYGIYDYLKPAGTQYIVFATSGKIYKNATTTIKTGWTASKHVWFSMFDGELYVCNGADTPGKWDGTTWTDLTDIPTDWGTSNPKYMITHGRGNQQRNWAFGCPSTPYTLYVSPDGDGDDFQDANVTTLKIDTKDGYGVMGGTVFLDQMLMFSRTHPYIIDDADGDTTNWGYAEGGWQGGVAHQRLIIPTPYDIICVDENLEIYSIIAAQSYGDYRAASLARPSFIHNWIKDNVREAYIANFHGIYDPELRAVRIFVVRNGQTEIDTALVYFIDRGPKNGWMIQDNKNNNSGFDASCSSSVYVGAGDYQIYTGDYSGWIWNLETSTYHDNAKQFDSGFRTTTIGSPPQDNKFRRARVICDPQGTETINLKVYIDETQIETPDGAWATSTAYTVGNIETNDGAIYECTVAHTSSAASEPGTGADWEDYWVQHRFSQTVASGTKDYAYDIGDKGELIEVEVYNNTVNEDMVIEKLIIEFKPVGTKPA